MGDFLKLLFFCFVRFVFLLVDISNQKTFRDHVLVNRVLAFTQADLCFSSASATYQPDLTLRKLLQVFIFSSVKGEFVHL